MPICARSQDVETTLRKTSGHCAPLRKCWNRWRPLSLPPPQPAARNRSNKPSRMPRNLSKIPRLSVAKSYVHPGRPYLLFETGMLKSFSDALKSARSPARSHNAVAEVIMAAAAMLKEAWYSGARIMSFSWNSCAGEGVKQTIQHGEKRTCGLCFFGLSAFPFRSSLSFGSSPATREAGKQIIRR